MKYTAVAVDSAQDVFCSFKKHTPCLFDNSLVTDFQTLQMILQLPTREFLAVIGSQHLQFLICLSLKDITKVITSSIHTLC